jgi:hypothetical protein
MKSWKGCATILRIHLERLRKFSTNFSQDETMAGIKLTAPRIKFNSIAAEAIFSLTLRDFVSI